MFLNKLLMTRMSALCEKLEATYPYEGQVWKAREELSEALEEASYFMDKVETGEEINDEDVENLLSELCDVLLCFEGIIIAFEREHPEVNVGNILRAKMDKATKYLKTVGPVSKEDAEYFSSLM